MKARSGREQSFARIALLRFRAYREIYKFRLGTDRRNISIADVASQHHQDAFVLLWIYINVFNSLINCWLWFSTWIKFNFSLFAGLWLIFVLVNGTMESAQKEKKIVFTQMSQINRQHLTQVATCYMEQSFSFRHRTSNKWAMGRQSNLQWCQI